MFLILTIFTSAWYTIISISLLCDFSNISFIQYVHKLVSLNIAVLHVWAPQTRAMLQVWAPHTRAMQTLGEVLQVWAPHIRAMQTLGEVLEVPGMLSKGQQTGSEQQALSPLSMRQEQYPSGVWTRVYRCFRQGGHWNGRLRNLHYTSQWEERDVFPSNRRDLRQF